MKKRIWQFGGIGVLTVALGISVIQLMTPIVRADGCPSEPFPDCMCDLEGGSYTIDSNDNIHWYCTYSCLCTGGGGGGEPFRIIREYSD